jgi:hypothetical protein
VVRPPLFPSAASVIGAGAEVEFVHAPPLRAVAGPSAAVSRAEALELLVDMRAHLRCGFAGPGGHSGCGRGWRWRVRRCAENVKLRRGAARFVTQTEFRLRRAVGRQFLSKHGSVGP